MPIHIRALWDVLVEEVRELAEKTTAAYDIEAEGPMDSDECIELTAVFHKWLQQSSGNMSKEELEMDDDTYLRSQIKGSG